MERAEVSRFSAIASDESTKESPARHRNPQTDGIQLMEVLANVPRTKNKNHHRGTRFGFHAVLTRVSIRVSLGIGEVTMRDKLQELLERASKRIQFPP
jgi:hypothetical protein